jgi:hypothetical protein
VVRVVESKVATLVTAESIIVGFLVAFAPGVNQALVSSMMAGKPSFGAVLAGFLISALALTAFRSILLLYQSIDASRTLDDSRDRYRTGYDLFLMVILGSGVYVLINAVSILHYALTAENVSSLFSTGPIVAAGLFFFACTIPFVFFPFKLTKFARCIRKSKAGTYLSPVATVLAALETLFAIILGLQGFPPWESALFGSCATVELGIVWVLMMPKNGCS